MLNTLRNQLRRLVTDSAEPLPNKYSVSTGKLIRQAREEAGYSQAELGKLIYRRQATISDMENGKIEVSASTLLLLAYALQKPLSYFFDYPWKPLIAPENTSEEEQELLWHTRRLDRDDLRKLIIQVRAIADAYDRKEAEVRGEEMQKYMQKLKVKKANRPRNPDAFDNNAFPPGEEGEKLRAWYGLMPQDVAKEPKAEPEKQPAKQQPKKPQSTRNRP